MKRPFRVLLPAFCALMPQAAIAIDPSFSRAVRRTETSVTHGIDYTWYLVGVVLVILFVFVGYSLQSKRRQTPGKVRKVSLSKEASRWGFKRNEARIIGAIAGGLAARNPEVLLNTEHGRDRLIGNIRGRIRHREKELVVLKGMVYKLNKMNDQYFHARESERIEADVPVWIVKQVSDSTSSSEEAVLDDVKPVSARLVDISEGGAALQTDLDAQIGDITEFWSSDSGVLIPPLTGAVVQTEPEVLHVKFLDPPTSELQQAINELGARRLTRS